MHVVVISDTGPLICLEKIVGGFTFLRKMANHVLIKSASDDHGTGLKADPQVVKISNSIFSSLISRTSLDFLRKEDDKARDVVYVTLQLTPPSRSATRSSMHATLEVVTGDPEDIIIGGVVASGVSPADSALLAQSGWSMSASLNEKKSHLLLKGTMPPILEHDLIDEKGESLSLQSASGIDSQGNITSIEFMGYRPLPITARLKLIVLRHRHVTILPIVVENLALP